MVPDQASGVTVAAVGLVFVCVGFGWAYRTAGRYSGGSRLPMQWGPTGRVTWTAPRRVAVAFVPVTGALVLGTYAALALFAAPRPGDEDMVVPVLIGLGLLFLAIQWVHYWGIERTLQRHEGNRR